MSKVRPVKREHHGHLSWNKAPGYAWTREEQIVAAGWQEAMQLMMSLPLAFARHDDNYVLVVMLGLHRGDNLMVGPDGNWLGPRVPGVLQHHPFRLLRDTAGRDVLGVVEDSLLPPHASGGTPLFDSGGAPAADLSAILGHLVQNDRDRSRAREVTAVLAQYDLISAWDLKVSNEEGVKKIGGLYRIDEEKLNKAPGQILQAIRDAGALVTAYAQILSSHHVHRLGQIAVAKQKQQAAHRASAAVTSNLISDDGIISFDNL